LSNISIYIHWPFCLRKCPYCDFNSHVSANIDHDLWLKSYDIEIQHFADIISGKYVKSIFFGGGTPSLMRPNLVGAVIDKISSLGLVDKYTEISLEANPTSFETEKFKSFKLAGVNRISIGAQSFVQKDLTFLGREHNVASAIYAIESANNIFTRVSFDLIYARSNQTIKEWEEELNMAMKFATGHISLYQLMIEKNTIFYKMFEDGKLTIPKSDIAADMYEMTNQYLKQANYNQYEISNYAKIGEECIHNLTYWNYETYLGIGPGAHSRIISESESKIKAIMMRNNPNSWLDCVKDLGHGIQYANILSTRETIDEAIMMGLRLKNGINIANLQSKTGRSLDQMIDMKLAAYYQDSRLLLLDHEQGMISLTEKGLQLHNYLIPRLLKA